MKYDGAAQKGYRGSPGERNGRAKINRETAEQIRGDYSTGEHSQTAIAQKYGISQPRVSAIVRGESWTDV